MFILQLQFVGSVQVLNTVSALQLKLSGGELRELVILVSNLVSAEHNSVVSGQYQSLLPEV